MVVSFVVVVVVFGFRLQSSASSSQCGTSSVTGVPIHTSAPRPHPPSRLCDCSTVSFVKMKTCFYLLFSQFCSAVLYIISLCFYNGSCWSSDNTVRRLFLVQRLAQALIFCIVDQNKARIVIRGMFSESHGNKNPSKFYRVMSRTTTHRRMTDR